MIAILPNRDNVDLIELVIVDLKVEILSQAGIEICLFRNSGSKISKSKIALELTI